MAYGDPVNPDNPTQPTGNPTNPTGSPTGTPPADPFGDWYKNTILANPDKYDTGIAQDQ